MKKILCIAAVLSLAAPAAFGQADSEKGNAFGPRQNENSFAKTSMVFLSGGDTPEGKAVAKEMRAEMMRSRRLEPVFVDDDRSPRLIAPMTAVTTGENVTVTYELRTARRFVQTGEVTCAVSKPAKCATEVVTRAEKFMRDNKNK